MAWWMDLARDLQDRVWVKECEDGDPYDEDGVKRAIVHARGDVVLLVSLLSSVNRQLRWIWMLLGLTCATLIVIAIRLGH